MNGVLAELSLQLLGCADPWLLDAPLDVSCKQLADEDARDLLIGLFEAGNAARLRDLLEGDTLARWAHESCTGREEESLIAQLRSWLGTQGSGADDPERLVTLPLPPTSAAPLLAWAERHEVARMLGRPAAGLVDGAAALAPDATLWDCCLELVADTARGQSALHGRVLAEEARTLLYREALRLAAHEARAALHRAPLPPPPLDKLARRLRALIGGHELQSLEPCRFVPARAVQLEPSTGICSAALRGPASATSEVVLRLSGFEQRALEARCSTCTESGCLHVAALAARCFEACIQRDDRLHAALTDFARVPSWQRFLAAIAPAQEPSDEQPRIVFSLRIEGDRVWVGTLLRRPQGKASLTPGKLVSPATLARSPYASEQDQAVLAALAARGRTLAPQYVVADLTVLRSLVEHTSVQREGGPGSLRVFEEALHVELLEQPEGLLPRVTLMGRALTHTGNAGYVFQLDAHEDKLVFAPITPAIARLLSALDHFRGVLPPESYPALALWLAPLRKSARVSLPKALTGLERPPPERLLLRITPLPDEGIDLMLTVRALPLAPLWSPGHGPELVHGLLDGAPCAVRRDLDGERAHAQEIVDALALQQALELGPYRFRIDSTQPALAALSAAARLERILELEWAERRTLCVTTTVKTAQLSVALFKQGQWCALAGGAQLGERLLPIERLLEAARQGERFVPIGGGDYAEIEQSLFERLELAQLCTMPRARELGLSSSALPAWKAQLGDISRAGDDITAEWLSDVDAGMPAPWPGESPVQADLRSYQKQGLAWLVQRSRWAKGVCLADEMGLGKTVQTIALLALRSQLGPALVIAPTSVVEGWLRELARFAPALRALPYRGPKREALLQELGKGAVLVASYDVILRDRVHFDGREFATQVLDEAQWLKNARTLRARAVASLSAQFRIALTGTPIENRLADLWSLFHVVAPELLGGWSLFRARFAVPIERYDNQERAEALRELVAPLMLRRTKAEVARELPARTDVVHLIEPAPAERDLYAAALEHARSALGKRKGPDDTSRTVQLLAELTRLRQLACHPRLVLEDSRVSSSKLRALIQLLEDILPRGHRVLVFSQFVRHLALVREAVEQLGASYVYLDGQTREADRSLAVDTFQRGATQLFLISLKAGGTGLNLTAADYVVHMDPWWNPSAEDQASDRAHRIGQERPVTVVKLVTQGTIEERVLSLHEHKRRLASSILETTIGSTSQELGAEQLEALLDD